MKSVRFAAAIGIVVLAVLLPASALAGNIFTSASGLTTKAPSRLSDGADDTGGPRHGGSKRASGPSDPPASVTTHPAGELPHTGLDLLPETLIGVALLATGIALRARRA